MKLQIQNKKRKLDLAHRDQQEQERATDAEITTENITLLRIDRAT